MRKLILLSISLLLLLPITAAPKEKKLLFIGNSYTYGHNLPWMVQALLVAGKQPARVKMLARGAYSLDGHLRERQKPIPRDVIAAEKWDYVILQDQSSAPIFNKKGTINDVVAFDKLIKKRGAKTLLFMTWAYKDADEMTDALALAYCEAGQKTEALIAPVGLAWRAALKKKIKLHSKDGSHPNINGAYLTACVFYSRISARSPVGLPSTLRVKKGVLCRLNAATARSLQRIAWQTVKDFVKKKQRDKIIKNFKETLLPRKKFMGKLHKQLTPAACLKLFGKPAKISKNSGEIIYTYSLEDEKDLWLIFKQGKLSSATIDFEKLPMAEKL